MKRSIKHHILGWLSVPALLLTAAACTDDDTAISTPQGISSGTGTVTFKLQTESQSVNALAGEEKSDIIGDGRKTDLLIFTVYEVTEDDGGTKTYTPLEKYAKGSLVEGITVDDKTQTAIGVSEWPDDKVTIQLIDIDTTKTYAVAFWGQNKQTQAYDTRDLKKVEVKYNNAKNNDELRDAFCTAIEFDGKQAEAITATLRRPLAQINIGTKGWDYEGAAILRPDRISYTQSKITIGGVARYYNVLAGKTLNEEEAGIGQDTTTVRFESARMPAFRHLDENEEVTTYERMEDEELLRVDVDGNKTIDGYVSWADYDTYRKENMKDFNEGKLPSTEEFKYLSMCYVLVPEGTSLDEVEFPEVSEEGRSNGSVLSYVKFEATGFTRDSNAVVEEGGEEEAESKDETQGLGEEEAKSKDETQGLGEIFTINNVPVQKNWRTNILGNNLFIAREKFILDIIPQYCGDYNNYDGKVDDENNWPGFKPDHKPDHKPDEGNKNEDFDEHDKEHGDDYYGTPEEEQQQQ